jgi:N-acylneuraminate cytidylyltransferase
MNISAFLPCRSGSQRVINKNTRPFSDVPGGILEVKLRQLLLVNLFDEIVLSTDDELAIEIAKNINNSKIRIERRPKYLCESTTKVEDLINYVPTIINSDHVFWVHATTPLVNHEIIAKAILEYEVALKQGFDSIMSVTEYKSFLWDAEKKDIINFDRSKIKYPQTQDLRPLYEINHAFYAMSKKLYLQYRDRIGKNPYLFKLSKIEAVDIDWDEDFIIAEQLFNLKK